MVTDEERANEQIPWTRWLTSPNNSYTVKNLVLNEHKLLLNHTQALCLILTTQACLVLTQDHVFSNTKHKLVLQEPQALCCF